MSLARWASSLILQEGIASFGRVKLFGRTIFPRIFVAVYEENTG